MIRSLHLIGLVLLSLFIQFPPPQWRELSALTALAVIAVIFARCSYALLTYKEEE